MKPSSKIIIGCMSWGKWAKQLSTKEQIEMIQFCLENGNSFFDHADLYGDYTTESEFGKALQEGNFKRDDLHIITKCGIQNPGQTRNNYVKHYNYAKDYIIWSAEQSLKNLKTDYLDTFLLHRPSPLMNPSEIAEAINQLKESGKIKNFGVSNFTPSQVDLLNEKINAINEAEQKAIADEEAQKEKERLAKEEAKRRNSRTYTRRSTRQDPLVKVLTSATFIRAVFGILKKVIK